MGIEKFPTGSVRDTREGKGRFDLISPVFLQRLAVHYENGSRKYGDRNWEKGQPVDRYLDSALRHIVHWMSGRVDEDHLIAAAWNLAGAIHTQEMIRRGILSPTLDSACNPLREVPNDPHVHGEEIQSVGPVS